ncbi:non-muscle caldesmon isoform X2 [Salmo trutta]|uniref:non-muscle caldesmon isoform X2 n=1 Tax=Salmo trutta TaxID=8032 RepID=UPI00113060EC|nr:non-muscle caldesmon-like isoform X2 [Salmo trutta]
MDDDFDQRMELRRQRREQMRLEAEKGFSTTDDDEEVARERRRNAREERMKKAEMEESSSGTVTTEVNNTHSVTETESYSTGAEVSSSAGDGDDVVLLDRLAKREERRQKRLKEALDRQKEFDPTITDGNENSQEETFSSGRHQGTEEEKEEKPAQEEVTTNSWSREEEEVKEEEATPKEEDPKRVTEPEKAEEVEEEKKEEEKSKKREAEKVELEKPKLRSVKKDEKESSLSKQQNGGVARSTEAEDQERLEAERKLEELKRRRDEADSEEFEKMKQKQQESEAELEELKKKREGRKKIIEEEEKQKKAEMAEKKAKEQEERKRLKEEIEQRRKDAAEKKKQMIEESGDGDKKPFTLGVTPKGKIGERAEFLNQRAQKGCKTSHAPIVSKIGNRLELYTAAVQTNRDVRSPKSPVSDLPETPSIRNIKSMWEKGNIGGATESPKPMNKDAADIKVGVAGLTKGWGKSPADTGKAAAAAAEKADDLKPVDVGNKRSLWETKGSSPAKVTVGGKNKSVTNGVGR